MRFFQLSESGELQKSRIVHFATHGFVDRGDPRLSGLVLSLVDQEKRPVNGFLRLFDLARIRLNAELTVLSACQTGLGAEQQNGDGLLGLYQGFLTAGSRQVLCTLWAVDDEATKEFMKLFYTEWANGSSAKAALSHAQGTMARSSRWSKPYFWAGFQLVGR